MRIPEPDEETPLAWTAVAAATPVLASDGTEVGVASEMRGAQDIFHGVVVRSAAGGADIMVPAAEVRDITNRRIAISLTPEQVRSLPAYQPEPSFRLGNVPGSGEVGWVEDEERPGK